MQETPYEGRATITKDSNFLEIVIPSKKNWFSIIFLAAWLGGWTMGEISAFNQVFDDGSGGVVDVFIIFWLIAWTIGGCGAILILLWLIGGQEKITVDNGEVEIRKQIFEIGLSKEYSIPEIKYLTLNQARNRDQWGRNISNFLNHGQIEFDYGLRTIKFASDIDAAEARLIIETFKQNPNFRAENFR